MKSIQTVRTDILSSKENLYLDVVNEIRKCFYNTRYFLATMNQQIMSNI